MTTVVVDEKTLAKLLRTAYLTGALLDHQSTSDLTARAEEYVRAEIAAIPEGETL